MKKEVFIEKLQELQKNNKFNEEEILKLISPEQLLEEMLTIKKMGKPNYLQIAAIPETVLDLIDENLNEKNYLVNDAFYEDAILKLYYLIAFGVESEFIFAAMQILPTIQIGFYFRNLENEDLFKYMKSIYLERKQDSGSFRGLLRLFIKNFNLDKDLNDFSNLVNEVKKIYNK